MRKAKLGIMILIVAGCGAEPTYITAHRFQVYDELRLTNREEVEELTEFLFSYFDNRGQLERKLEWLDVYIVDVPISGTLAGAADLDWIKVAYTERFSCLAETAYIHEILHLVYLWTYCTNRCNDPFDKKHIWVIPTTRTIKSQAIKQFCLGE